MFHPADRLDEGYIGTLEVSYEGTTCLTLPVSYSGYVNSNDDVAVAEAYKNGSIRPALIKEKKSYWKYIIAAVVVACILGLFIYANVIEPRKRKQNSRSRQTITGNLAPRKEVLQLWKNQKRILRKSNLPIR